ncbi:hypothetical protein DBR06_SOUSAS24410020, partial [Sousa chinensis]
DCKRALCHNSSCVEKHNTHSEEKPHRRNERGNASRRNTSFIEHQRIHNRKKTPKSYECNKHGKIFRIQSLLPRHERTHNGGKPCKC